MRSGKGPKVWAAHFEFLVFLQHALDLCKAARASPGVQLSSKPLGPDQQFLKHCLQLLSFVQGIQRLLPAHRIHQLVTEPPALLPLCLPLPSVPESLQPKKGAGVGN